MADVDAERVVLCIEDVESSAQLVDRALRRVPGVRVVMARNGQEAREVVATTDCAVVLTDLNLPDVSGAEWVAELVRAVGPAGTPVVVVSADATSGAQGRGARRRGHRLPDQADRPAPAHQPGLRAGRAGPGARRAVRRGAAAGAGRALRGRGHRRPVPAARRRGVRRPGVGRGAQSPPQGRLGGVRRRRSRRAARPPRSDGERRSARRCRGRPRRRRPRPG